MQTWGKYDAWYIQEIWMVTWPLYYALNRYDWATYLLRKCHQFFFALRPSSVWQPQGSLVSMSIRPVSCWTIYSVYRRLPCVSHSLKLLKFVLHIRKGMSRVLDSISTPQIEETRRLLTHWCWPTGARVHSFWRHKSTVLCHWTSCLREAFKTCSNHM